MSVSDLQHSDSRTTADFPKQLLRGEIEEIKPTVRERPQTAKVRVEDKLIQGRKATLRKIEEMRKRQEDERMQASPGKPQISKKTEDLAAKAEQRFFMKHSPLKASREGDEGAVDVVSRGSPKSAGLAQSFARARGSMSVRESPRAKKRALSAVRRSSNPSSLIHLSSLQRNQVWQQRRDSRLAEQRKEKAKAGLQECTFAPIIYSRVPHTMQRKSVDDLMTYSQSVPDQFDRDVYSADVRKLSPGKSIDCPFATWMSPSPPEVADSNYRLFSFGEAQQSQYRQLSPYKVALGPFSPERFLQSLGKDQAPGAYF